jgi:hypothetical protein
MSNLTNCGTVFVLDPDDLSSDHFVSACNEVAKFYTEDEVAFLVSPTAYAEKNDLRHDKIYRLWSFDTQHTDSYLDYVSHLVRKT